MVYVVFVSVEYRFVVNEAYDYYSHHVKTRHYQECVGHEQADVAWRNGIGSVHGKLDAQKPKDESNGETARIAHENLVLAGF